MSMNLISPDELRDIRLVESVYILLARLRTRSNSLFIEQQPTIEAYELESIKATYDLSCELEMSYRYLIESAREVNEILVGITQEGLLYIRGIYT